MSKPDANWAESASHTLHVSYTVGESATTEGYLLRPSHGKPVPENDAPVITIHTPSLAFNGDEVTEALITVSSEVSTKRSTRLHIRFAASGG
jgi:hypothetical protein